MLPVALVVEGPSDEAVVTRLVVEHGLTVGAVHVASGKARIDQRLSAYASAGRHQPWLVVRDLDQDAECAPSLVQELEARSTALFRLHVAVRAVEAWLMADRQGLARYMHVPAGRLPADPDQIVDPKRTLVQLARDSRARRIRVGMVPDPGASAIVGRAYTALIAEFATRAWDPRRAAERSPSLRSLVRHLTRLAAS